jgi:hypothetical protein
MDAILDTAGERIGIDCRLSWVDELLEEAAGSALRPGLVPDASIRVRVEAAREAFSTRGWTPFTRGAWRRGEELIVENVCTTGFDLHILSTSGEARFTFRWRPPARERVAARVLRSRFHLLTRAVLVQYPALWCAGTRGRAPLHASACTTSSTGTTALLTAPSGVGRSTTVLAELRAGGTATGDNLSVATGSRVWGLVEPIRVEGSEGRRMPHGRREVDLERRAPVLEPDRIVVLERGTAPTASVVPCAPEEAERSLVTNTYMAGELRRYWAFAALLAAGTGVGPAHPPVAEVASELADALPCFRVALGEAPGEPLPILDELPAKNSEVLR